MLNLAQGSGSRNIGYVAAIDGLRAVAVVSVMLFHLNRSLLPGGYVGVDVFFVISGFVVTGSLMGMQFRRLRDLLLYFYARRLIRIMPALVAMLLATIVLYAMFIPDAWLTQSVDDVARSAFLGVSNVRLMLNDDSYFSPRAEFNPFTHTWSLGIEEQFYLAFPFLLFWHHRQVAGIKSRHLVVAVVVAISAASLLACAWLSAQHPKVAFYSIPSRFWELGIGMVLRLKEDSWKPRLQRASRRAVQALSLASAGLIAASFVNPVSGHFPFPLALPPVIGATGLIALVCAKQQGLAHDVLSSRPMVVIGTLSYSLYLWHWPVFVLCRWTIGLDGVLSSLAALVFAVVAGALSFVLVERPVRRGRIVARMPRGRVVAGALAAVAVAYQGGTVLLQAKHRISLSRTAQTKLWYADELTPIPTRDDSCALAKSTEYFASGAMRVWQPQACAPHQRPARLFVMGDSHSLVYVPSLRRFAAEHAAEIRLFFKTGCSFIALDRPMTADPECQAFRREAIERMLAVAQPGDVLFLPSLRIARYADQWGDGDAAPSIRNAAASPQDADDARAVAVEEGRALVGRLRAHGLLILFEAPTPVFRSPAFRCSDWFNAANPICSAGLSVTRGEFEDLRAPVLDAMRTVAGLDAGVRVWDPAAILCSGTQCSAVTPAGPLFFDGDHLSGYANEVLYPDLSRTLLAMPSGQASRGLPLRK